VDDELYGMANTYYGDQGLFRLLRIFASTMTKEQIEAVRAELNDYFSDEDEEEWDLDDEEV
jgi:hypothetical protein